MTRYIIRKCLNDNSSSGRKRAGIILAAMGIFFDLVLFASKHLASILSGSIAVTADAYNNLSDAGAHILALLAFPLGDRKPSKRFPFGYGRLEYFSGLIIAAAILFVSFEMLLSSVEKILHPKQVEASTAVIVILLLSIAVKAYMYRYNKRIGEQIDSAGLKSVAMDSICDCFATTAILLSMLIQKCTGLNIDGWAGLMVAVCILYAGIISAKESLAPLLGLAPDDETLDRLHAVLRAHPQIERVENIAVHDYGPTKKLLTMRVSGAVTSELLKELKDEIAEQLHIDAVIEFEEINRPSNNRPQSRQE